MHTYEIFKWWYIFLKILRQLNIESTMINLQNSESRIWYCDKTMKHILKQIRKSNYNELNIEG
jgi:hypothetical protein